LKKQQKKQQEKKSSRRLDFFWKKSLKNLLDERGQPKSRQQPRSPGANSMFTPVTKSGVAMNVQNLSY